MNVFQMGKLLYVAFVKQCPPITDFHSAALIKFIGKIAKEKVLFVAKEETTTKCLAIPINKKLALAKPMLTSLVNIV